MHQPCSPSMATWWPAGEVKVKIFGIGKMAENGVIDSTVRLQGQDTGVAAAVTPGLST